jgi:2-polyprenyl-6-methoxyphenol hydroxylase-like FAD-dependent oxidoreductase
MCEIVRGEGANHGITDIAVLLDHLLPARNDPTAASLKPAMDAYEREMIRRKAPAVLASRRACLDAHDYEKINDQSPPVSRRVMPTEE